MEPLLKDTSNVTNLLWLDTIAIPHLKFIHMCKFRILSQYQQFHVPRSQWCLHYRRYKFPQYSAFRLGKKMAAARNGNIYIEFYSSNNNVRQFLQLFSVLMLFNETINYKTGPCVIRRSIKMILKKVHFFSKRRFGEVWTVSQRDETGMR